MLSTAADLAQLAGSAPWLAVGALALVASAWVYRQTRRAIQAARDDAARSAARQGERIGDLEKAVALLVLRRRQVEQALLDEGVELPYWPPDGPQQPRPATSRQTRRVDVDDDLAAEHDMGAETMQRRLPVPPLNLPRR